MKRAIFLATAYAYLVLLCPRACWGAPPQPGSPEAVVTTAVDAVNHGRIDEFASAMHPDSLNQFRTAVVGTIDAAAKRVGEAKLLESFPGVKTVSGLKALDATRLFAGVVRRMTSDPGTKKSLANTQIDVYGHVSEGKDTAHVVYRSRMKLGEMDITRFSVATLRKSGQAWKMVIPEDFTGPMNQGGPGNLAINLTARRVEPLGHLLDGQDAALILYRTEETTAVARPGYAVGAINTHTGLTVDGFEMVFMRIDGDRLNSADSYKSPWLGDQKGGSPRDVASDGKVPVGLQGRAGKEVYALGLIVEK